MLNNPALEATASHYLDGPCCGVSIHRKGCLVWVYDQNTDSRFDHEFPSEEIARQKVWDIRHDLYEAAYGEGRC